MKNKFLIIRIVSTLLFAFIVYYLTIPAINLHNMGFYVYLLFILGFYIFMRTATFIDGTNVISKVRKIPRKTLLLLEVLGGIVGIIIVVNVICSPIFNSKSWANRITIDEENNFTDDIVEVDFNKVPLLDKDSSQKLGDRVMGQMSELVSQFYVSNLYTQINYNNELIGL